MMNRDQADLAELEQYSHHSNVRIFGLPEKENENCKQTIDTLDVSSAENQCCWWIDWGTTQELQTRGSGIIRYIVKTKTDGKLGHVTVSRWQICSHEQDTDQ